MVQEELNGDISVPSLGIWMNLAAFSQPAFWKMEVGLEASLYLHSGHPQRDASCLRFYLWEPSLGFPIKSASPLPVVLGFACPLLGVLSSPGSYTKELTLLTKQCRPDPEITPLSANCSLLSLPLCRNIIANN
jgi:hypothetical protein